MVGIAAAASNMSDLDSELAEAYKNKAEQAALLSGAVKASDRIEAMRRYEMWSQACHDVEVINKKLRARAMAEGKVLLREKFDADGKTGA
jgi:hypothetical protein